jgi:hypothetical protein
VEVLPLVATSKIGETRHELGYEANEEGEGCSDYIRDDRSEGKTQADGNQNGDSNQDTNDITDGSRELIEDPIKEAWRVVRSLRGLGAKEECVVSRESVSGRREGPVKQEEEEPKQQKKGEDDLCHEEVSQVLQIREQPLGPPTRRLESHDMTSSEV